MDQIQGFGAVGAIEPALRWREVRRQGSLLGSLNWCSLYGCWWKCESCLVDMGVRLRLWSKCVALFLSEWILSTDRCRVEVEVFCIFFP